MIEYKVITLPLAEEDIADQTDYIAFELKSPETAINMVRGFKKVNNKMEESIRTNRMMYPYILDLVNNKVLFYNAQAKQDEMKQFEVDIFEIQDELKRLEKNVDDFDRFL